VATAFEYLIFVDEKRDTNGTIVEPPELIVEHKTVIAKDMAQATLLAGGDVPTELKNDPEKMDRLTVAVRPF